MMPMHPRTSDVCARTIIERTILVGAVAATSAAGVVISHGVLPLGLFLKPIDGLILQSCIGIVFPHGQASWRLAIACRLSSAVLSQGPVDSGQGPSKNGDFTDGLHEILRSRCNTGHRVSLRCGGMKWCLAMLRPPRLFPHRPVLRVRQYGIRSPWGCEQTVGVRTSNRLCRAWSDCGENGSRSAEDHNEPV